MGLPRKPNVAAELRQMRAAAGLTQAKMARALGVSLRTYHGWECGKAEPRASLWERIKTLAHV